MEKKTLKEVCDDFTKFLKEHSQFPCPVCDDCDDDDDEMVTTVEDTVYEAPEKLILLNWMENIGRRMDTAWWISYYSAFRKDQQPDPGSFSFVNAFLMWE